MCNILFDEKYKESTKNNFITAYGSEVMDEEFFEFFFKNHETVNYHCLEFLNKFKLNFSNNKYYFINKKFNEKRMLQLFLLSIITKIKYESKSTDELKKVINIIPTGSLRIFEHYEIKDFMDNLLKKEDKLSINDFDDVDYIILKDFKNESLTDKQVDYFKPVLCSFIQRLLYTHTKIIFLSNKINNNIDLLVDNEILDNYKKIISDKDLDKSLISQIVKKDNNIQNKVIFEPY
jgi:hypothetical protein